MDTHNRESTEGDEATLGPRAWARLKIYHTLLESEDKLIWSCSKDIDSDTGAVTDISTLATPPTPEWIAKRDSKVRDAISPSRVYSEMMTEYREDHGVKRIPTQVAYACLRQINTGIQCTEEWSVSTHYSIQAAENMFEAVRELRVIEAVLGHSFDVKFISAPTIDQDHKTEKKAITDFCSAVCMKCGSPVIRRNTITDSMMRLFQMSGVKSSKLDAIEESPYDWIHRGNGSLDTLEAIVGCDDMKMNNAIG